MLKYREQIVNDTMELVRIPSKKEEAMIDCPYGKPISDAFHWMLNKAEKDRFVIQNYDNYAGRIEYGTEGHLVGVVCHYPIDVDFDEC
ncbi:MAG: hypothetical protein PUF50_04410 [Erysipelotrichaceae bacterium]|nr:hypothetical protein [Erysipelotrichaceae bacterium]